MGGIIGMSMCAVNPRIIRHLVLNDIGSFVSRNAIERLLEYVGKVHPNNATNVMLVLWC